MRRFRAWKWRGWQYLTKQVQRERTRATNAQVLEARRLFDKADTNKDGVLSEAEFAKLMRAHENTDYTDGELAELFRSVDIDKSGTIEFSEFLQMQLKRK